MGNGKILGDKKPCDLLVLGESKLFDTKKSVFHKGMKIIPC
jgi:hypothetical protein